MHVLSCLRELNPQGQVPELRRRIGCPPAKAGRQARQVSGLNGARVQAQGSPAGKAAAAKQQLQDFQDRTWVTRKGIHVDRMASAWLIRRFIDPNARFKFVPSKGYQSQPGEIRFDMYEAEFTHEGDRCTFEVLIERMGISDPGLGPIAEIVHDIDLKDAKFVREETPGIDRLIAGIAMANKDDEARLVRGTAVFDDLYEFFKRKSS
jgi:hypothetical protein